MDIIFECSHCGQELEVDDSAAGSELECPSCSTEITVPAPDRSPASAAPAPPVPPKPAPAPKEPPQKFSVPFTAEPTKELIKKPQKPLEVAAKEDEKVIRIKTIRRADCKELDRDNFDETVSAFLQKVGQDHIIAMHPVNYSTVDNVSQKLIDDYGLMIIFRG